MVQTTTPPFEDDLPPAVAPRSRRVSPQFAAEAEGARQRRAEIEAQTVGSPLDIASLRLQKRRAHKAKLAPQPLGSRPRGVVMTDDDLNGVADNMASEVGEFDPLSDDAVTADMEQSENADS